MKILITLWPFFWSRSYLLGPLIPLLFIPLPLFAKETTPEKLATSNNAFALDLFHTLNKTDNLVFYPYSVSTALAIVWAGARSNTETQIAQVLHFSNGQKETAQEFDGLQSGLEALGREGNMTLYIANSLWLNKNFRYDPSFLNSTRANYEAEIRILDLSNPVSVSDTINQWVELKTGEKIKNFLTPQSLKTSPNERMGMVLVNAVYFLGTWMKTFESHQTHARTFYLQNGSPVTVQMMNQTNSFSMFQNDETQVLELPYRGGKLSMVLILPRKSEGLPSLEQTLTPDKIEGWLSRLRGTQVNVVIPKFKFSFGTVNLIPGLQSLGMTDAFDNQKADFSGLLELKSRKFLKPYIKFVLHKAFIAVDEKGTEAAAATAGGLAGMDIVIQTPVFYADHPFLFLIRDKETNSILFMGRMADPGLCQK